MSPSVSPSSPYRFEVSLQQNEIMDAFIDDYRSLSDSDDIMGNKSDTNLKVQLSQQWILCELVHATCSTVYQHAIL